MAPAVTAYGDQGVGFIDTGAHYPARPMIFEGSAGQMNAIGQQGRGQRIAREALQSPAVEREAQGPGAIDESTGVGAKGVHGAVSPIR